MTPIKTFRPRWADRCLYRRRPFFRRCAWGVAILLAAIFLWFSVKQHMMYADSAAQIAEAHADVEKLLDILRGKKGMAEYAGKYLVIEKVVWQLEEEKK